MKRNILASKSVSNTIIIGMLFLISIMIGSCDNVNPWMIPDDDTVVPPEDGTDIVDTIDYIKALHNKREELRRGLAKERNTEVVSFPDRLVIPHLDIAKPLDSIDQWIYDVNTTEIIKALNADLEKLQQDIAAVRNQPPEDVGTGVEPPVVEPPVVPPPLPEPPVVVEPPVVPPPPPPDTLQVGDRVIVKNTSGEGIRIRSAPNEDRIGGMFDGETGIIISGPEEFRGLTWFEIEWDAPVKNPQSGCGAGEDVCIGWSAVIVENGTQVIHKRE